MKKIISLLVLVMLVAIFSVTALAADTSFGYLYDCDRTPAFPKVDQNTTYSGFGAPKDDFADFNSAGNWSLEYLGKFGDSNVPQEAKNAVDTVCATLHDEHYSDVAVNDFPVYAVKLDSVVKGYVTVVAKYNNDAIWFAVNDDDDGKLSSSYSKYGYGYLFSTEALSGNVVIEADEILDEEVKETEKVTVSFNLNGGTPEIEPIKIEKGAALGELFPEDPTKEGYRFEAWTYNWKEYTAESVIDKDITLYAKWTKTYTVSFKLNGGTPEIDPVVVDEGETLGELFPEDPTKEGYTFDKWTYNWKEYTAESVIDKDITLHARWLKNYTVTYIFDGEEYEVKTLTAYQSDAEGGKAALVLPETEPEKVGYTFKGWYTEADGAGEKAEADLAITEDKTYYAYMDANEYTVTFCEEVFSGSTLAHLVNADEATKIVTFDEPIGELPEITRYGYNFVAWVDDDGNVITADTVYTVDGDSTYHAVWEAKTFTLYFDANWALGIDPLPVEIVFDEEIGELPVIYRGSHTFLGWYYKDGEKAYADDVLTVESDIVLRAKWRRDTCDHVDKNKDDLCDKCDAVLISSVKDEEENPNTGASAPSAVAAIALIGAAAYVLGKRK